MDKDRKYKISNLSYVLQIGQTPKEEEEEDYSSCRFDDQKNFVIEDGPYPDVLWPWEWVMHPEIVELAKQLGVEIPEEPELDMSKTF